MNQKAVKRLRKAARQLSLLQGFQRETCYNDVPHMRDKVTYFIDKKTNEPSRFSWRPFNRTLGNCERRVYQTLKKTAKNVL